MANLTPITQGMQQGAQAIQNNFESINNSLSGITEYKKSVSIPSSDTVRDGTATFYRKGNQVRVHFNLALKKSIGWAPVLSSIPMGYTPGSDDTGGVLGSTSYGGRFMTIYHVGNRFDGLTGSDIGGSGSSFTGDVFYNTSDDPVSGDRVAY